MAFKMKYKDLQEVVGQLKNASNIHGKQAKIVQKHIDKMEGSSPNKKRMGDFKHSDAPDAKGKFRELSAPDLATWMIKSRKGNLSRIISSLNQQVVFRRNTDPKYAAKMRRTMDIVRKRLGKKK